MGSFFTCGSGVAVQPSEEDDDEDLFVVEDGHGAMERWVVAFLSLDGSSGAGERSEARVRCALRGAAPVGAGVDDVAEVEAGVEDVEILSLEASEVEDLGAGRCRDVKEEVVEEEDEEEEDGEDILSFCRSDPLLPPCCCCCMVAGRQGGKLSCPVHQTLARPSGGGGGGGETLRHNRNNNNNMQRHVHTWARHQSAQSQPQHARVW
jgi:hypothetical protein